LTILNIHNKEDIDGLSFSDLKICCNIYVKFDSYLWYEKKRM